MVGIPEKRDYEKEVHNLIQKLGRSESISRMATKLRIRNEYVSSSLKNLHARGLLQKHDDETYPYYTPLEDSAESYLNHIEQSIEFYHNHIDNHIKELRSKKIFINVKITKLKPYNIFKDPKTGKTIKLKTIKDPKITYSQINPKIINSFKGFVHNLNYLLSLASKIRLLRILKSIPKTKYYDEKCEGLENKIYSLIESSLTNLEHEHSSQRDLLKNHLEGELPFLKF